MAKADRKKVGYWNTSQDTYPEHPMPQDLVDDQWDATERMLAVSYVSNTNFRSNRRYRGWSECRICGCHNGSSESFDSVYVWPEGFLHYLTEHHVKPPQDFIDHVFKKVGSRL